MVAHNTVISTHNHQRSSALHFLYSFTNPNLQVGIRIKRGMNYYEGIPIECLNLGF